MRAALALPLILTACTPAPSPAPRLADACPVPLAMAQAINRSHGWRTVTLDAAALGRAKQQLMQYDEDNNIAIADGAFFVYLDEEVGLAFLARDCLTSVLAPFSREEIEAIVGTGA